MANVTEEQRLQALYAEMSNERLLELAGAKAGLTDVGQRALAAEMDARGIVEETEVAGDAHPELDLQAAEDDPALVELMTFQVAGDAEKALLALDRAGIPVRMEAAMRRLVEGGPRIQTNWLTVFVERERQQDAVKVMREKMGLFPVLTPAEMDAGEGGELDEDSLFTVGDFDLAADAEVARKALQEAGIWFKETQIAEPEITVTVIETRMEDLERAQTVVEAAFAEG